MKRRLLPAAAVALAAIFAAGCATSDGTKLDPGNPQWREIGLDEGAKAGERAAWMWWNKRVDEVDGLFAAEIARPQGIIDPTRAYFIERVIRQRTPEEAVVEEEVILLSRAKLAPDGVPGFADSLRVPVPPADPSPIRALKGHPEAYREAFAEGWNAAYTRSLHEREMELDLWVLDRYAVFRADWLARYGGMDPARVLREPQTPENHATRRAARRERWRVIEGEFRNPD